MNIYQKLNESIDYIEKHLENSIDYDIVARKIGTNLYTARKIFQLLTGVTISDYIRNRRLSKASRDINNGQKIIDIALKYQYDSPASFSRAFKKYHGASPSKIREDAILKNFPRITLDDNLLTEVTPQKYQIQRKPSFSLYGFSTHTTMRNISVDAPIFFSEISRRFSKKYGHPPYGMVSYDDERKDCKAYSVLYTQPITNSQKIIFPNSDWLIFRISSQHASDIQEQSKLFYLDFLPSCKYNLRNLPELEFYHDEVTDFLVAIESN